MFLTLKSDIKNISNFSVYNKVIALMKAKIIIQVVLNELTTSSSICQILLLLSHLKLICTT